MSLQVVQTQKPWANDGTVALPSIAGSTVYWLQGNTLVTTPTAAAWFEVDIGHADVLRAQFASEIQATGGIAGTGATAFAVVAGGIKRRAGVFAKPKPFTVAPPVAAGYGELLLTVLSDDWNRAFDPAANGATTQSQSGLIRSGIAPVVGDTPVAGWKFSQRFATSGVPALALTDAFSVSEVETAWLAFAVDFTGAWTGLPTTTFRTKAELEITTYNRRRP